MRTAVGLLALAIAGGVGPVGFWVMPYLRPLLTGTVVAFLILLTLCLVASALRRRRSRGLASMSSHLAPRSRVAVRSAEHRLT